MRDHLLVAHDLPAFGGGFVAALIAAFLCMRRPILVPSYAAFVAWD